MLQRDTQRLPKMLYADSKGRIYDHPYFRMAGFSGSDPFPILEDDLMIVPEFSKLFYFPQCPPVGLDPETGEYNTVHHMRIDGEDESCFAVAAFLEPGLVRTHLPGVAYHHKSYVLPMWGYTAVGFQDEQYVATAFPIEYSSRWDPRNYDDQQLIPAIKTFLKGKQNRGPLLEHLRRCATDNHCFAAKNLFLGRWEAPLPASRQCNAACLGCLSEQSDTTCPTSHQRIAFRPSKQEIVALAVQHLNRAPEAIVSFGQGCEGEPLLESDLIADSIREIRGQTKKGTINLNTNGSLPGRVLQIAESGLDSIRISLNSARPDYYHAYYRPRGYTFHDVLSSMTLCAEKGLYTMVNYLVFPGITDQEEEIEALVELIEKSGVHFIHLKNLNIDPDYYLKNMPGSRSQKVGIKKMVSVLKEKLPDICLGYFNQPVADSRKMA
jgi:pyruvate-formate lyase-activating enzyme